MPLIEGVMQDTAEWVVARVGCVTASRMCDVMAKRKDMKEAASRYNYKMELVIENLTGRAADHFVTPAMQWGIDTQPMAAAAYELEKNVMLEPGGLWIHPDKELVKFAASPDYLLGEDALIEVKCPTTVTHLEQLISGEIAQDYQWQMLAQMACTGRKYCEFVSFDPRLPEDLQLFVKRFERDDKLIRAIEVETKQLLKEVDATLVKLKEQRARALETV